MEATNAASIGEEDSGLSSESDFEEEQASDGPQDMLKFVPSTKQGLERHSDRVEKLASEDREYRLMHNTTMKNRHVGLYGPPKHLEGVEFNAICIIHTGGTIGMRPASDTDARLVSAPRGELLRYIKAHPAFLSDQSRIFSEEELWLMEDRTKLEGNIFPLLILVECIDLIDSTNATFKTWNEIATRIWSRRLLYKSFVVTHGTDSLAYTASALTFMLGQKDSCIPPIVITGSQVPIYAPLTDGLNNFIGACCAAGWEGNGFPSFGTPWPEITVYFDNKLMLGSRVVKKHAQDFDAFETPNKGVLAVFTGGKFKKQGLQLDHLIQKRSNATKGQLGCFLIHSSISVRILYVAPDCVRSWMLPVVNTPNPGNQRQNIANRLQELGWETLSGVIVCAYGAGNAPNSVQNILKVLRQEFSIPVAVLTECFSGAAEQAYETAIQDAGVTLEDMTLPAAYAKMTVLAGRAIVKQKDYQWIEQCMVKPIRGEFTHQRAHRLKSDNVSKK
jgi:L-asparaginase